jgi:ribosome-binding protein aMBF1 (putative translation factor)
MTEKEQKILDYVEKRKKFKLEYDNQAKTPLQIKESLEKQGFTKETLTKDIEEYNTLLSDITHDDLKDDKLVGDLQKIRMKFLALRRICVMVGIANNSEVPQIKTLS